MTDPHAPTDHPRADGRRDETTREETTRRGFLKAAGAVSAGALLAPLGAGSLRAGGADTLRVGLIGCGGRGRGAAIDCVRSSEGVKIVALGDAFEYRIAETAKLLEDRIGDAFDVKEELRFVGLDAYEKVLACRPDLVILATPPGFRPVHLRAAVEAGIHVFAEKPVAVDPPGVRSVIESARMASEKGLAIVAGTQRRHQTPYVETIRRIHDGAIGDVVAAEAYWNQGGLWVRERERGENDVRWQIRNWLYFPWLSGDHIVEQHVHNLDVLNWVMRAEPVKVVGMGGRQVRTGAEYGCIFDHFAIELEYPGGVRAHSYCRQIDGTTPRVAERIVGTRGVAEPDGRIEGPNAFRYRGESENPYVREHADLVASIRAAEPLNEGERIAKSTLTAIMGRMAAYTGKEVTWEFAMQSKLDLTPPEEAFRTGVLPVADVPVPGRTPLV